MSKVLINSYIESEDAIYKYHGKGLKNKNKIIYNDNGILTTVTINDIVWLERKKDYYIKMGFKMKQNIKGEYNISGYSLDIETYTKKLLVSKSSIEIEYLLTLNNVIFDTFKLNLTFSIDT